MCSSKKQQNNRLFQNCYTENPSDKLLTKKWVSETTTFKTSFTLSKTCQLKVVIVTALMTSF